jgi:hypothetical protein
MMDKEVTMREGGSHTIVTIGSSITQIPRHREILTGTLASIVKDLESELGKRWLKK